MPITRINYGSAPDDGTGDPLRVAFKKTDDNFVDLDNRKAEQQDVADALATKVDKVAGKGLSTEDFTTAEKQKLDGVEEGAQVNPGPATSAADGLMSAADKAKLDGIDLATDTEDGLMSAADKAKLDGVEDGATTNSTDAYLLERANHTGTQPASTITGLSVGASFTTVPTTNQGPSIVVTEPHLRFMVWNGTKYVRAPWHAPGQLSYFLRDVPAGYVEVRSDVVLNAADFPDLAEYLGVTESTFILDEARGEFLRALDSGRGVDVGRVVGSPQGDAIRNITGELTKTTVHESWYGVGALSLSTESADSPMLIQGGAITGFKEKALYFNASNSVPTASENRPTNIAYRLAVQY